MSVTFWCFTLYNIKSNSLNTGEHHTRDGRTSHPRKQRWYPELRVAILRCWGHRVACVAKHDVEGLQERVAVMDTAAPSSRVPTLPPTEAQLRGGGPSRSPSVPTEKTEVT